MEELYMRSHTHSKEQRAGSAHESNQQQSRLSHASKCAAAMASPPSTPSPTSPFVHLDSTSTASLSHLAPRSNAPQLYPPNSMTTESDASSPSACHATSPAHEVPIENVFSKRVSLEQHLQHGDAGREEAMQSFILERFLPAAKIVAADHDHTMYSSGRPPITTTPSTIRHSSATMKAAPVRSNKSPPTVYASNNVAWSHPSCADDDAHYDGENGEMPAKSCGFFCAGLKSAMSRSHNIAHVSTQSAQSASRIKSRATTQPSSHRTTSDEEDLLPKVKVMVQGTQRQRGIFGPASTSFATRSPTPSTIQDAAWRRAASLNKTFASGPAGSSVESLNSRPSLNLCVKCHSNSFLHRTPMKGPPLGDSIAFRHNDVDVGCSCHVTQQTPGDLNVNNYCPRNASKRQVSSQVAPSQVDSIKESPYVSESAVRDRCCPEDDELEFHDALSRFDMSISTQSSIPPLEECDSQSQDAHVSLTSDEHNSVETHLQCIREGEILAVDGDHEGHVEIPLRHRFEKSCKESSMVQQIGRITSQQGNRACAQPFNGAHSSMVNTPGKNTPREYHKTSSSPMPGWPLGISSFQTSTRKASPQETKNFSDGFAANTKVQFATMADELRMDSGRCLSEPSTMRASMEVGTKHCKNCVANTRFSMDVLPPPVPPSPTTTSSWLGKALALKASKPSYVTTLRQEEKLVSCQKKVVEFTAPSDRKKEVRWEDVVKGSQMHPEHFGFSEENRHHHPANQDAMKPLTL